jgi:DNA end-binding protein Ku
MPRAIWSGSISFGLVNVPVKLHSATESRDVRFHQFQEGTDRRIHYKRVAEGTDDEVDYDDIVKGYEVSDGRYVMVTPEELESVEPGKTRTIDIEDFVELAEIDPVYFEKSYYLAPDKGGEKAYVLLREAMRRAERVAIGRFVMRTKQYLGAIRPSGDALILETMFFGDEVRDPGELDLPGKTKVSDRELKIADQLIESLTVPFDPMSYADTYREQVLDLIEAKAKGEEIVVERRDDKAEPAADLMAALEASVSSIREARDRRRGAKDLASLSKDELYERATAKDVPGRSKMSKDELIEALQQAS